MTEETITQATTDSKATEPAIQTRLLGVDLLFNSRLNKGTAFTEEERDIFRTSRPVASAHRHS